MPTPVPASEPPANPSPTPQKKRLGCLAQFLIAGALIAAGLGTVLWHFADRTRRANNFGNYIKQGFTVRQVFAGPREWDFLWVRCGSADADEWTVFVSRQDGAYAARNRGEETVYPNFDAVVEAMTAGQGPFQGLRSIHLVYKFYMPSRTYNLLLGPDGRVVKIDRISLN